MENEYLFEKPLDQKGWSKRLAGHLNERQK